MDIRQKLRVALLKEGAHKANEYGCVMLYLGLDKSKWKELQDQIDEKDLYLPKNETGYGKETDPHVTILYGLHEDIPYEKIEAEINKIKEPEIKLGKISLFTTDDFDVLKFDVISEDLHKYNKQFTKFPHTNDFPKYHPHCTIAYVNKGTAKDYISKLNKVAEIDVTSEKIVYSMADGKKKNYKL